MTAIIDYGAGNTKSIKNLLNRLGKAYVLTADPTLIKSSDRLILPGVGHALSAMDALKRTELIPILKAYNKPFLGICLGMQLMYEFSDEGNATCLGLVPGTVKRFDKHGNLKVPHMGWNTIKTDETNPIFRGLPNESFMYFVHSYYAEISDQTIASCDYIKPFSAAIQYRNYFGVQFHPEKSGLMGQTIIENFLKIK